MVLIQFVTEVCILSSTGMYATISTRSHILLSCHYRAQKSGEKVGAGGITGIGMK